MQGIDSKKKFFLRFQGMCSDSFTLLTVTLYTHNQTTIPLRPDVYTVHAIAFRQKIDLSCPSRRTSCQSHAYCEALSPSRPPCSCLEFACVPNRVLPPLRCASTLSGICPIVTPGEQGRLQRNYEPAVQDDDLRPPPTALFHLNTPCTNRNARCCDLDSRQARSSHQPLALPGGHSEATT